MPLASVFKISLYFLVAWAGGSLALASWAPESPASAFPSILTVPAALAAYWLNERLGKVRISVQWSNVLGLVAFIITGFNFWPEDTLRRLQAGSSLLVYLTWIVLFQEKRSTQYWILCALALLQMAVGSIQSVSGLFGIALLIYMFLVIWTVSIFSLYQAELRVLHPEPDATLTRRGYARNSVEIAPDETWLGGRFCSGIFGLTSLGLVLGLLFFFCVPRMWQGGLNTFASDSPTPAAGKSQTGFSNQVTLGQVGRIQENLSEVLRVRVINPRLGRLEDLERLTVATQGPLFRGNVFETYEQGLSRRTSWIPARRSGNPQALQTTLPRPADYRVEIHLEPITDDILLGVWPLDSGAMYRGDGFELLPVQMEFGTNIIFSPQNRGGERHYFVGSTFDDVDQPNPEGFPVATKLGRLLADPRDTAYRKLLQVPPRLENLRRLARDLTAPDKLSREPDRSVEWRKAMAIVRHLRDSGQYAYSLDQVVMDDTLDPVEDFLFKSRSGACEYYGSALTLMLRAVDIPARMVNGFKGAIRDEKNNDYFVQQRHAHVWTEAYFDGAWQTLDATPAARDLVVAQDLEESSLGKATNWVSGLWDTYIVDLSPERQQRMIFQPARLAALQLLNLRFDWSQMLDWVRSPKKWFSVQGGVVTFILGIVLAAGWWTVRQLGRLLPVLRFGRRGRRSVIRVEFFERFLDVLKRHGWNPRQEQTPLEFITEFTSRSKSILRQAGLDHVPQEIVDAFYQIRFGEAPPSDDESRRLQGQIERLDAILVASHTAPA